MQQKQLRVIAKLGRVCDLLKAAESMPETRRCTDNIRRARLKVEDALIEMKKKRAVNWSKVSGILGVLSKVYSLLKLLGLEDILNFCYQRRFIYEVA